MSQSNDRNHSQMCTDEMLILIPLVLCVLGLNLVIFHNYAKYPIVKLTKIEQHQLSRHFIIVDSDERNIIILFYLYYLEKAYWTQTIYLLYRKYEIQLKYSQLAPAVQSRLVVLLGLVVPLSNTNIINSQMFKNWYGKIKVRRIKNILVKYLFILAYRLCA